MTLLWLMIWGYGLLVAMNLPYTEFLRSRVRRRTAALVRLFAKSGHQECDSKSCESSTQSVSRRHV